MYIIKKKNIFMDDADVNGGNELTKTFAFIACSFPLTLNIAHF